MTLIAPSRSTSVFFDDGLDIFDELESSVRSYCRKFPVRFERALNATIWDASGKSYIDFLSCAGAVNYGHNNPVLKAVLIDYLHGDGVTSSLDMHTVAKAAFLESFREIVLKPRALDYKIQFTGPTGTNSIEAALKIARRVSGRNTVVAFTNGFHGMTLGSLALTGNVADRAASGTSLNNVIRMPYCGYFGQDMDSLTYLEKMLLDPSGGMDKPAAFVLETVQGEGGLNVASIDWLQKLAALAEREGILLIVDEVQTGCGRTGTFFSFERAGIKPDLICLSKSIGGFGLPFALVLVKPEWDRQKPGEHNGTFRGNNLAFVTARRALSFWQDGEFLSNLAQNITILGERITDLADKYQTHNVSARGLGMMCGLVMPSCDIAKAIQKEVFVNGLILETCGPHDEVVKIMPALTIEEDTLHKGMDILEEAMRIIL